MVRVGATFSLRPDLIVELNQIAQRERTSVSAIVEQAIRQFLEQRQRARPRSGRKITVTASDQEE